MARVMNTAEMVDGFLADLRTRLLESESVINVRVGMKDATQPGDIFRRLQPDGRYTWEIHVNGGVHRKDPERHAKI